MTSFASRDRGSPSPPLHEKRVIRLTALSFSLFLFLCVCPTSKSAFREKRAFLSIIFVNYITWIIPQIRNRVHLNIRRLRFFNSRRKRKKKDRCTFSQDRVSSICAAWYRKLRNSMPPKTLRWGYRAIFIVRFVPYLRIDINDILQPWNPWYTHDVFMISTLLNDTFIAVINSAISNVTSWYRKESRLDVQVAISIVTSVSINASEFLNALRAVLTASRREI